MNGAVTGANNIHPIKPLRCRGVRYATSARSSSSVDVPELIDEGYTRGICIIVNT